MTRSMPPKVIPLSRAKPSALRETRAKPPAITGTAAFERIVARLQDLDYLPITRSWIRTERGGHFVKLRHDAFRFPVPPALQTEADAYAWNAGNPFVRAALVQFERQNDILGAGGVSEGFMHPAVETALLSSNAKKNRWRWEWVLVTKGTGTDQPEQLHIWEAHQGWIWHTLVNTGVLGSTPDGTWPIYQRLPSTIMRGVFPVQISWSLYNTLVHKRVSQWTGSRYTQPARGVIHGHPVRWLPYSDPGVLWVNYFDRGRGIHAYPRARYGFPQSAGCVEEPFRAAPVTYRLLHYGVPVTVSPDAFGFSEQKEG